ncbi:MAG: prepilin-type N-terminal cleavage/methylation domain-containing protein [Opitutaceae bacterium]|nr:prepilin-type N-terminal cleavage/methylation domain-containing protein [Cephaloticoccus sp.]MCP5529564.1 prepilin-type N-terminal cleavage/methylation domain-containing protein [Opitutaceae bacterium]
MTRKSTHPRAAFTLIELIAALALMAMLLTALLTFVLSMSEIWGGSGEKRLFEQHVNAVTHHLNAMLRRAALPSAGHTADEAFVIREVRAPNGGTIEGLGFFLPAGDRLLSWNGQAAPLTACTLGFNRNDGLILYWRSELEEDEDAIHETPLSPFISALTYDYRDENTGGWRDYPSLQRSGNRWRVPEQIVLQFKHGELTATRTITLPLAPGGLPLF